MKKHIIYILLACVFVFIACDKTKEKTKEEKLAEFIGDPNFIIAPSISTLKLDYVVFSKINKKSKFLFLTVGEHDALAAFDVTVKPTISLEDIKSKIANGNVTITYNPKITYEFFHKNPEATILQSNKSIFAKSLTDKDINEMKNEPSVKDSLLNQLKHSPIEKLVHTTFQSYIKANCVAMGFDEKEIKFIHNTNISLKQ